MTPDVVSMGEPLLEFNAQGAGPLRAIRSYEVGWGGDTSNFLIAARRLGASAGYVCRLGDDEFGEILLDLWLRERIDVRHVIREQGAQTGIYFISRRGADHSFTYYRKDSAASHLTVEDVPEAYISGARVFHTSGITQAISETALQATERAIEVARAAQVLVSYDPNIRLKLWEEERARDIALKTIAQADFVFPSLEDAAVLTSTEDPERIAAELLTYGPSVVAVKMGDRGALLATADGARHFNPFPVEVVDTTGAGDAFDGAFIAAYLRGDSLEDCARFANAAGALTTTGWGAVNPIPNRSDVEALLS